MEKHDLHKIDISIVLQSDIMLNGLSSIIRKGFKNRVFISKQIEDIPGYPNILGDNLLIMSETAFEKNKDIINRVFQDQYKTIFVNNTTNDNNLKSIDINDSLAVITLKISDLLKSFEEQKHDTDLADLSLRETDVLRLIAKGFSNKEIADNLHISTHTVITHRKNITEKLGIKSASGLTVYAAMKKIINIEELNPSELI